MFPKIKIKPDFLKVDVKVQVVKENLRSKLFLFCILQ